MRELIRACASALRDGAAELDAIAGEPSDARMLIAAYSAFARLQSRVHESWRDLRIAARRKGAEGRRSE